MQFVAGAKSGTQPTNDPVGIPTDQQEAAAAADTAAAAAVAFAQWVRSLGRGEIETQTESGVTGGFLLQKLVGPWQGRVADKFFFGRSLGDAFDELTADEIAAARAAWEQRRAAGGAGATAVPADPQILPMWTADP